MKALDRKTAKNLYRGQLYVLEEDIFESAINCIPVYVFLGLHDNSYECRNLFGDPGYSTLEADETVVLVEIEDIDWFFKSIEFDMSVIDDTLDGSFKSATVKCS